MTEEILTPEILVPKLGNYLVKRGLISDKDLKRALKYQDSLKDTDQLQLIGKILIEMGLIDRATLDKAITEQIIQLRNALQEANDSLEKRVQQRTAELKSAYQKLSELDQLKSNFIANISHELRTPLTHISGYLDLLSSGDLGPLREQQLQALNILNKAYNRLSKLIEDLILFSSVERGQFKLKLQEINPIELFDELEKYFSLYSSEKQIDLSISCPPNLPPVLIDRDRIFWVLVQFIDNAVKFSPEGGRVSVDAKPEKDKIKISIMDNGIGIPANKLSDIFEPFHQLDSSSTRKFGGTGIGLSLAQEIIEAHNSKIIVSSQVGVGTKFQFLLHTSSTNLEH